MNNSRCLHCWVVLGGAVLAFATLHARGQTLFSDNFDTDSSANWSVFNGSASGTPDYTAQFAFDYSTTQVTRNGVTFTIPPAPNGGGKGVKLTVNKNDDIADIAAVSIYPAGKTFSGEFSFKFDMWLNYNGPAFGGSGSTEFGTFGINHAGDKVNWDDIALTTPSPSDGVWFAVTGEAGAANDYRAYVGDGSSPATRSGGALDGMLDRDGDGAAEEDILITGANPPTYPLCQIFPSPQFESKGMPGKEWVQVEIRQRTNELGGNVVTWLINNYVITEHSRGDSYLMTSGNVMLGNMDIFSSIASPKADNFVIYDNVRVVSLAGTAPLPVVTVVTNDGTAAEPADPGSFTVTRYGDATQPLTVQYRMAGSASNGVDYALLPGSFAFAAGQTVTNLTVAPINDVIGEGIETAVVVLLGSTNYDLYTNISAIVTLADDADVPLVNLSVSRTNAYERNPNNEGRFVIAMSNPSSVPITVTFTLGGNAVAGTDYSAVGTSVTIPAGETNAVVRIKPIDNTKADPVRTVTLTLASGTGYALGSSTNGTVTIRDDDFVPLGNLLYSETYDTDSTANWAVNASAGDHPVDLFFDYSTVGIPPAPNTTGGTTRGAKLQANLSGGAFGGVSISPASLNLTNDYVLRFDLWQNFNGPAPDGGNGSTQITGGGVGTTGTTPQWPGGTQNSVWFATSGDGGSSVDYRAYSSAAGTGYADASGVFAAGTTGNPRDNGNAYYYEFGRNEPPAEQTALYPDQRGASNVGAQGFIWRDIVIQKQANVVKWFIDGKLIATVNADTTNFSGGNILLMHSDINTSSSADINAQFTAFGLFDNVRVYALAAPAAPPRITRISLIDNGVNALIEFTGETSDTAGSFAIQAAADAAGPYLTATSAIITQASPGNFRALLRAFAPQQFYRIRRL